MTTTASVSTADIDYVMGLDEADLAAVLVASGAGTEFDEPGPNSAAGAIAKNMKSAAAVDPSWIWEHARRMFSRAWPKVKAAVCKAYEDRADLQIGSKDWVKYLIDAAVAVLGIAGKFAAAVVAWAIKEGLDMLCAVEAEA